MVTNSYERMSVCELEGDALSSDVLNRLRVTKMRMTELNRDTKMVETLAYIWDDVRKHNNKIGDGATLDVPLSSARSHSCTPLGMAAMFSDRLNSQAEKEACSSGQSFELPQSERVAALATFKPISDYYEMDMYGWDPADLRHEMRAAAAMAREAAGAAASHAAPREALQPVVDTEMVRQLSRSRSQRLLSQRLLSQRLLSQHDLSQRRVSGAEAGGKGACDDSVASQRAQPSQSQSSERHGARGYGGRSDSQGSQAVNDSLALLVQKYLLTGTKVHILTRHLRRRMPAG